MGKWSAEKAGKFTSHQLSTSQNICLISGEKDNSNQKILDYLERK